MRLLRMFGILLAMAAAVGFGVCGVYGLTLAASRHYDTAVFLVCGLVGVLLAFAIGRDALRAVRRHVHGDGAADR